MNRWNSNRTFVTSVWISIKCDALSSRGNISGSHQSNVQAKNKFLAVQTHLDDLDDGLETLVIAGMSEGELEQRSEMVARLQDDCGKLTKMVSITRQTSQGWVRHLSGTLSRTPMGTCSLGKDPQRS